jgi:hypothetical protein
VQNREKVRKHAGFPHLRPWVSKRAVPTLGAAFSFGYVDPVGIVTTTLIVQPCAETPNGGGVMVKQW